MMVQDQATPERLGPYRLLRRLGEGGMGVVYLATGSNGQLVAVKALHPALAAEENARRRLAREVETMLRVRSPYVAEVIDADVNGDPPYIVTRYVPGMTLDAVVSERGPLTQVALARLARGLAEALAAIHAAGVVHRDLKPGNVMITGGEPVVIDFGIAQSPETTRLTMTGMFMGTPGYLAPEVIEGHESGTAADVHSLGATLAFAATGRPPFGTGTFETIFYRIVHGQPDLDTLPAPLRSLVLRSLSRDPAARPSAAELSQWAATLDPASLVPSPAMLVPGARPVGAPPPNTAVDRPGGQPGLRTRPLALAGPADVRDLLPPVTYRPPGAAAAGGGGFAGSGGFTGGPGPPPGGPGWVGTAGTGQPGAELAGPGPGMQGRAGRIAAGRGPAGTASSLSGWSPLVIGVIAVTAAASVLAPIVGTASSLILLLALRAVSITGRQLTKRRSADGRRAGEPLMAVALFPLAVLRALVSLLLLAPVALLGFGIAVAATIIAVPAHPLPRAMAFGAGALVAIVGLGPGSAGARKTLAGFFGSVARTPTRLAVAYVGVLAVAAWAALTAIAQPAAYWPANSLHAQLMHLPTVHSMLTDARLNLLRLARQLGL